MTKDLDKTSRQVFLGKKEEEACDHMNVQQITELES